MCFRVMQVNRRVVLGANGYAVEAIKGDMS